jgi:hypothetical protein
MFDNDGRSIAGDILWDRHTDSETKVAEAPRFATRSDC